MRLESNPVTLRWETWVNSNICALQAVKLITSELFIQFSHLYHLILSCSRQTTIQAIEAKLKMMEHSSVKDFEVNNAPSGSLFGHQRPSVSQPSIRRYRSRGRCDSRPYRRPTNHRRWSISVTFSQTLSSDNGTSVVMVCMYIERKPLCYIMTVFSLGR